MGISRERNNISRERNIIARECNSILRECNNICISLYPQWLTVRLITPPTHTHTVADGSSDHPPPEADGSSDLPHSG